MRKSTKAVIEIAAKMSKDMPKSAVKSVGSMEDWFFGALRKMGAKRKFGKKEIRKSARVLRALLHKPNKRRNAEVVAIVIALAVLIPRREEDIKTQGALWDFIMGIFGPGGGADGGNGAGGGNPINSGRDPCLSAQLRYEHYSVQAAEAADAYNDCLARESDDGGDGGGGDILQTESEDGDIELPSNPCSEELNAMQEAYERAQDAMDDMNRECGFSIP